MRIALLTFAALPSLHADDRLLAGALAHRGADAVPVVWDDPSIDWRGFDAAVVRSTWDYTWRRDAFLARAEAIANVTRLWNPPPLLRWNAHKRYLGALAARGVPVVPTEYVDAGAPLDLAALGRARGWDEVVVKPCVSAGARDTVRLRAATGQAAADALRARGDLMVQPYQPAVERDGEHSLVFFDGRFSHAVRKHPQLVAAPSAADPTPRAAAPDELATAARVLAAAAALHDGTPPLYARVDLVRAADGTPQLMELEAFEPRLFFTAHPAAADTLAAAILHRLA